MATKSSVQIRGNVHVQEPKQYNVVMHNDDFTTMDFVVSILIEIFHKTPVTAEELMMKVHKSGRAVVGTYPYDIACTKVRQALNRARAENFPFRMTVEEA
ncbi:MAG: ATP-dependent Clp protease adaptor ClpS [Clostridia bacterium]|nr:ATP-dependent Clp protease adaptor ClpS [Clostridia bacterium]